jgi:hypothetical protein
MCHRGYLKYGTIITTLAQAMSESCTIHHDTRPTSSRPPSSLGEARRGEESHCRKQCLNTGPSNSFLKSGNLSLALTWGIRSFTVEISSRSLFCSYQNTDTTTLLIYTTSSYKMRSLIYWSLALLTAVNVHAHKMSNTGRCGKSNNGLVCTGSAFGNCCSQ